MKRDEVSADYLNSIWKFFASLQLTIVILLSLAGTSIIGTLIPQNETATAYVKSYGEMLYRVFSVLDLFDMYHAWWFQFLILLLTANVLVCSFDRLSITWKVIFVKIPKFNLSSFTGSKSKMTFTAERSEESLRKETEAVASKEFGYVRIENIEKGFAVFAEKWRWTRLGVYFVHLSVILLLMGSLIGSIFGFEGFVNIAEGEKVSSIRLRSNGEMKQLDFEIQCDDFDISFYPSGAPKEYRSSLTLLEGGNVLMQKDIIVNDPLRFRGINLFQSSYGEINRPRNQTGGKPPEEITVGFTSMESGMQYEKKVAIGQVVQMPEGNGTFVLKEYRPSAAFMGQDIGESIVGVINREGEESVQVLLPMRFSKFDKMRKGKVFISILKTKGGTPAKPVDQEPLYYTGLQVTKDPGVWVVYTGFMMMILGCFVTFFMSHQRLCIAVIEKGKKRELTVSGRANKNKLGMQNKVEKIAQRLANLSDQG